MTIKEIAQRIIETGAAASAGPWIAANDCVASTDPELVARMREYQARYDANHVASMASANKWSDEERAEYARLVAEKSARWYGGGSLICESIGPADRAFVAAARDAPEVARRMLELEDELDERKLLRAEIERRLQVALKTDEAVIANARSEIAQLQAQVGRLNDLRRSQACEIGHADAAASMSILAASLADQDAEAQRELVATLGAQLAEVTAERDRLASDVERLRGNAATFDQGEAADLANRVLTDPYYCGDEHKRTLARAVLTLLAQLGGGCGTDAEIDGLKKELARATSDIITLQRELNRAGP